MLEAFKTLATGQYMAALSMLKACVDRCPNTIWNSQVAHYKFWQVVFHTLFFTDLYLGSDEESFRRQPFHLRHAALFGDYDENYEPFEDPAPHKLPDKTSLLTYLEFCRRKITEAISAETVETLSAPSGTRRSLSRAEHHIYNIRHIQHHTAQLHLRLRLDTNEDFLWVGSGWREAAFTENPG